MFPLLPCPRLPRGETPRRARRWACHDRARHRARARGGDQRVRALVPSRFGRMADEVQRQAATMWHAAMLDQIYALPTSEHHAPTVDRNRQAHSSEHSLDMAQHIVWPFLLMGVA